MPASVQISGDDLAVLANSGRWHDAMRRMGRAAVEAELRRRQGRPTEPIDDIGGEPPYPTREFCERWCTEQDNILFWFSPIMAVVLVLFVGVTACLLQALGDFRAVPVRSASSMGGRTVAADGPQRARTGPPSVYDGPRFQPVMPPPSQRQQQGAQAGQQQRGQTGSYP
jgi:hypothetical protein